VKNNISTLPAFSVFGIFLVTILMLGSSLSAVTPASAVARSQQPTPPGILMATSDGGVRFLMGGVGSDERASMEIFAADYNVKFVFAERSGDYIADVSVVIDDLHGKSLAQVVTNGPWLYLMLSPGSYRVKATYVAKTMEIQELKVPQGKRLVRMLHWDFD
jgi:hypothetical protein